MKIAFQFALAILLCATFAQAADLAILRNGNSIRHERRQVVGAITRLYLNAGDTGYIEIPTDQIERFEQDTAPPPAIARSTVKSQPQTAPLARTASPVTPISRFDLSHVVNGAGERHQIDPDFINSVIRAESGFHQNAVSKKGAQGLMQLMPGTATGLGVSNPFDPNSNVEGGTKYLRELLEKYDFDAVKALAAYNAGSKRVDQYHGVPPYYETRAYVARIIRDYNRQKIAENPALAKKAGPAATRTRKTATPASGKSGSQKAQPPATKTAMANSPSQQASR